MTRLLWIVLGMALLSLNGYRKAPEAERPNIVIVMADDMGFSDIAPYGGEVQTPVLQRLADNGVRLTQFYNTARCCPTRASLLTGVYPHQAGVGHMMDDRGLPGYRGDLSDNTVTIAEVLRQAGYGTYLSGKWHVTKQVGQWSGDSTLTSTHNWPLQRGFDRFYGTITGAGSFYDPVTLTEGNTPIEPDRPDYYYTDAISDRASGFIEDHQRDRPDDPFFLYVSYTAPHWPLHALPEDIERYRGRYAEGWDALRETRLQRMIELGVIDSAWAMSARDPDVPPWDEVPEAERAWFERAMEVYAAQIDRMDQGIGRIVASLEASGQLDNTLILFLADNGGCAEVLSANWRGLFLPEQARDGGPVLIGNEQPLMPGPEESYQSYGPHWANASNTPFRRYKHWVHEGGIASPLIAHWPDQIKDAGALRDQLGHVVDLMATALDVAGAAYPESYEGRTIVPLEGQSLVPALTDEVFTREPMFWEHEGNRAVRDGPWKLVSRFPGDWELYDLEADRTEQNDLAQQQPEKVQELSALYEAWAARAQVESWDVVRGR